MYNYIRNGLYVIPLFPILYYTSNDLFLSTIICLKLFSANFWYYYSHLYNYNIPRKYNVLKQFIRLTDTGHLVSFVYYFNPAFFPVAFNVHFIISFAYWLTTLFFGMEDLDNATDSSMIMPAHNTFCALNHGYPLLLLIVKMSNDPDVCVNCFNEQSLYYTQLWLYSWLFFIYIPWRILTNDPVYSILEGNTFMKLLCKIPIIILVVSLATVANYSGSYLSNYFESFLI